MRGADRMLLLASISSKSVPDRLLVGHDFGNTGTTTHLALALISTVLGEE